MSKFQIILFIIITCAVPALSEEKKIAILTWRGVTESELGFVDYLEKQDVEISFNWYDCGKDKDSLMVILEKIDSLQPHAIYSFGTTITSTVVEQFTDIPIVFAVVSDPIGVGFCDSLGRSNYSNLTGVSHIVPMDAQLRAIKSVLPVRSIGFLYNPEETNSQLQLQALRDASLVDSIDVLVQSITDSLTCESEIELLLEKDPDIVYLPADSYIISQSSSIVRKIHEYGVPTFSATEEPIRNCGAYMGLVSRYKTVGQFAGHKIFEILYNDKRISEVEIERLDRFSLLINMKATRELDLYPPLPVFQFAEPVGEIVLDEDVK